MSKLEAFRAFDFESDSRWATYLTRLEIPAGREGALDRFKARWYRDNVDADFDPSLVRPAPAEAAAREPSSATSAGAAAAAVATRASSASGASSRPAPSARAAAAPPPPPPPSPAAGLLAALLLLGHLLVVVGAALAVFPLTPAPLQRAAFGISTRGAAALAGHALLARYGKPQLTGIKGWMERVTASHEFFRAMLGMIISGNPRLVFGVVSLAIASAFAAAELGPAVLDARAPSLAPAARRLAGWLNGKRDQAKLAAAASDISLGFVAVFEALTTGIRGLGTAWVLWNQLRLRLKAPETSIYHRAVWTQIGQRAQPVLGRVAILQRVVDYVKAWFARA